jgi:O-antigen ligase
MVASVAAVVWGALAFGAVYPWAYTPLALTAALIGLAALIVERRGRPRIAALATGLGAIGLAIGLQLVPLPRGVLDMVSPATTAFQHDYDFSYYRPTAPDEAGSRGPAAAVNANTAHPTSIAPDRTTLGLALFVSFALFLLGASRLFSSTGVSPVVKGLVWFGLALAVIGILEHARTAEAADPLIYGFWRPRFKSRPFGPYVNPNHFAGWMVMVLPLALMAFYEALLRVVDDGASSETNRRAIVRSPSFGSMLIFGFSAVVMGLALFLTHSRSGLIAFAIGSVAAAWMVFRRQRVRGARIAVIVTFLVLVAGMVGWAGLDTIVEKFVTTDSPAHTLEIASAGGRLSAWKDTLTIIQRFPIAGSGLDTYGAAMSLYETNRRLHFQEAHNDYLQLAAEGGLLVGLPIAITLVIFVHEVRRRFKEAPKHGTTYWLRVGAVIGLVSIAIQSAVEFSLQMPGNAVLLAVLAAIALHRSPNLQPRARAAHGSFSPAP